MNGAARLVSSCAIAFTAIDAFALPDATYALTLGTGGDCGSEDDRNGSIVLGTPTVAFSNLCTHAPMFPGYAQCYARITASSNPTVWVSAQTAYQSGVSGYNAFVTARLKYSIEAVGTAPMTELDFSGALLQNIAASANGGYNYFALADPMNVSTALFQVNNNQYVYLSYNQFGDPVNQHSGAVANNGSVAFSGSIWIQTNQVYTVILSAEVGSQNAQSPNSVILDPLISIDPAYLASNPGTTLLTSDGFDLPGCLGDLNGDGQVDDRDFVIFVAAYNLLLCTDPAMPPNCPADLNDDGQVDDSDFVLFVAAYDLLVCP
jgi:hypothetical protein